MKIVINNKEVDLSTIEIEGVNGNDFPEFCDAYVSFAKFKDDTELECHELDIITDDYPEIVNDMATEEFMTNPRGMLD
tara:strand:- start:76 stop:309 length:234 start_codon:yes stop_codon:yes gene_type:complete